MNSPTPVIPQSDPFAAALAAALGRHVLAEKLLLAPSLRAGNQWLDRAAWIGGKVINVRVKTLAAVIAELAEPRLRELGLERLPDRAAVFVVERILGRLRPQLEYLGALEPTQSLALTVHRSLQSLRLAALTPLALPRDSFETAAKGADITRLLAAYETRLAELRRADAAQLLRMALDVAAEPGALGERVLVVPADIELSAVEQRLLAALDPARLVRFQQPDAGPTPSIASCDRDLLRFSGTPHLAPAPAGDGSVTFFAALGEANEVREVLRSAAREGLTLDQVEVLHTSASAYVPLFHEILLELDADPEREDLRPPVTFAEGLPCRYSRPGRALQAWSAWTQSGFPQSGLVRMIRDGLLNLPPDSPGVDDSGDGGFGRTALALSTVGIGSGRDRYLPQIDARLSILQRNSRDTVAGEEEEEEALGAGGSRSRLQRMAALEQARRIAAAVIACSPGDDSSAVEILDLARRFLDEHARATTELDRYAAQKLIEEIDEQKRCLSLEDDAVSFDASGWLALLPAEATVLGSGPRPGCLHVAPLIGGGHSGRARTFLIGLDDRRFPRRGGQDPLLLDSERRAISAELLTREDLAQRDARDLSRVLSRLGGRVTLSYSNRNLADDSEQYPSPTLVALYRLVCGRQDLDLSGFQQALAGSEAAFAPGDADGAVDAMEARVSCLAGASPKPDRDEFLERCFPHLHRGRQAAHRRLRVDDIGPEDGLVPEAGVRLDPAGPGAGPVSASSLEMAAKCGRRFFFRHALHLHKPEDIEVDPDAWLDRLQMGRLLHRVFEEFWRQVGPTGQKPERALHQGLAHRLVETHIAAFRRLYPPPSESAYQRQRREIRRAADTFLAEEESYFAERNVRVLHVEAAIGMPNRGHASALDCSQPGTFAIGGGESIRVCGRIDRVDVVCGDGADSFHIWDYKSGSPRPYEGSEALTGGGVLQPILYSAIVEARLQAVSAKPAAVASFGFFFPGARGRGTRIEWSRAEIERAREAVTRVRETIRSGRFLPATDHRICTFCDYRAICSADGSIEDVTSASERKQSRNDGARSGKGGADAEP